MDELNTPADAGTEPVETQQDDTAPEWDYFDPDEDTEEPPEAAATDDGTEEPAEPEEAEPESEPAQISLPDGTQVTLDEAVKGYLRQADYTRKAQEVSQKRQALEADLQIVSGITETFIDHLTKMVPQAPDPSMALRDPTGYVRAKATYDAAMAQVQQLIEIGKKPKEISDKLSETDKQSLVAQENALLAERFPAITQPEGRKKFFESAATAAQELGFSMDELSGVTDHRMFVLAHWANEGMKAAKAREAAKAKVANVPPSTPRKPGQPAQANRNQDAMRKLARSGNIRDAVKIDWE
jgi:hypothetical protein